MIVKRKKLMSIIVSLFIGLVFNLANLFAKSAIPNPAEGLFYIANKLIVRIDGDLNEYENTDPIHLNRKDQAKYKQGDWQGPADCSGRFWLGWNDSGFVVAAETIDDSISFPFDGHDSWANDCLQFAVDVQDDNNPNFYQNDDREFVVTMSDSHAVVYEYSYSEHRNSGYRNYPVQMNVSGDTIRYEIMIPWEGLGIIGPFAGMHIGVSVVLFDNDGDNYRGWIEWTAGITQKKFTLPFANVLLFDPEMNIVQAIPTQTFISRNDSLTLWVYSRYYRKRVTYQLLQNNETLFRQSTSIQGKKWTKLVIPSKFLYWGRLTLILSSVRISQHFDIAVWSKQLITEQISYLTQQVHVFKGLKNVAPSASMTVESWIHWLESKFSSAVTDFDFYHVMMEAKRRIDQIPNFYMKKQVFYNRENRIVEQFYHSKFEKRSRRYLLHLPTEFSRDTKYPLFIFLHNMRENEEESARKIGSLLAAYDLPLIGVFPRSYPDLGLTHFGLNEVVSCMKDVFSKYPIDQNKVYLAGEGKGGREALILANQMPDRFAVVSAAFAKIDTAFAIENLKYAQLCFFDEMKNNDDIQYLVNKMQKVGGSALASFFEKTGKNVYGQIFSKAHFQWLLEQERLTEPFSLKLHIKHLVPSKAFWLGVSSQNDYQYPAHIEAEIDSNQVEIRATNLTGFTLMPDQFPDSVPFPLKVILEKDFHFRIDEEMKSPLTFIKENDKWIIDKNEVELICKKPSLTGPISAIFDKPVRFVYSTKHEQNKFNQLCYRLAKQVSRRGRDDFLTHLMTADTVMAKKDVQSNLIVFGNENANAYLKKITEKLPMKIYQQGIRFGNSYSDYPGSAALYIYPNPDNTDYLILVGLSPDTTGLKNLAEIWDHNRDNIIYLFDYLIVGNGVVKNSYDHWIDYGDFDNNWGVPWFEPLFEKGPKYWNNEISVGLDANQLNMNGNWQGGGKGNFTWKVYTKMEFRYQRKAIDWKNTIYCAFGQISVQEEEQWKSPEKSNDVIDFDSIINFDLEKFINPYVSTSLSTQFHEGYNPKNNKLVSRFANPLKLSQGAGIARKLSDKKKLELTTRLGYASKEVIATQKRFRELWTGDETKWMKTDGGIEWTTESKSKFKSGIELTSKIKLFQALFSSISPEKDPQKNWRRLDVYWEHMLRAELTKYIVLNVVMKFIYDRDVSPGGQFMENASLGLSYKF